jgi:hypothetical protein
MRKVMLSTLAAFLISGVIAAPSNADAGEMGKAMIKFPITMTSFAAGTAIGTPIAIIRKSSSNTKETYGNYSDGGMLKKGGGLMIAPSVGIMKGSYQGIQLGPKNAWANSSEHPFSKDVFSLGDLD